MRVKKLLALLMIYLIISLVFSSAIVLGTIYQAEIYGQDEVPGSIRPDDNLVVRSYSTMPCSVKAFFTNNTYEQMSCASLGSTNDCSYTSPVTNITGKVTATIKESGSDSTREAEAYVDNTPPSINSFTTTSLGNKIRATYNIIDKANPSYPEKCSGIKKVELYLNNQLVNTTNHSIGECSVNSEVTGTIPDYDGWVNTSIIVYDYMGFSDNRTGSKLIIDTVKPIIKSTVEVLKKGTEEEVKLVSTNSTIVREVDVRIRAEDKSIPSTNSVFGDFTEFDKTRSADQSNKPGTCKRTGWTGNYTCTFSGVKLSPSTLTPVFSVRITDTAGNIANTTLSASFSAHKGPSISSAEAYVAGTHQLIQKISTQSNKARKADIIVRITDKARVTEVKGDLTELSRTGNSLSDLTASCSENYDSGSETYEYNCTFRGISFNPATPNPKIIIRASDEVGGVSEEEISMSFAVINDPGRVARLGPEPQRCTQENCYVKAGINNITAEISTTSSYNDSNIYIQGTKADCKESTIGVWVCQANTEFKPGDTSIRLTGTDDLGNPITGETSVVVDDKPPKIIEEEGISIAPLCPTMNEPARITINITEEKSPSVIIRADTTRISEDNESSAPCTRAGNTNKWECSLSINNIKDQEINTELELIIEDLAGNQAKKSIPISICVEVDEAPDLIKEIKTRGTLPRIDRRTASIITIKVMIPLKIILKDSEAQILEKSMVDCSDTPGINGQAHLVNDESLKPILIIPLKHDSEWDEDDKVRVNCTQEFKMKRKNKVYALLEEERITTEIEVYNQPLGSLSSNYEKKVREVKKEITRLNKKIKKYEKIHEYLGSICNTAETIGRINRVIQSIKSALWGVCLALNAIAPSLGDSIWTPIHTALSGFHNLVETSIWPSGWVPQGGNTLGLVVKGTCALYTCKFYDFNTLIDIGMSIAAHYATRNDADKVIVKKSWVCDSSTGQCGEVYIRADGSYEWIGTPETPEIEIGETPIPPGREIEFGENPIPPGRDMRDTQKAPDKIDAVSSYSKTPPPTSPTVNEQLIIEKPSVVDKFIYWYADFLGVPPAAVYTYNYKRPSLIKRGLSWLSKDVKKGLQSYFGIGNVVASPPGSKITGESIKIPSAKALLGGGEPFVQSTDSRVQDAVDAFVGEGSWIYNPYKSKHYDGLCIPAILFNTKKEKQILCKYLRCVEDAAQNGAPLEACEFEYNLGMCLYVDSAQYKLEGGATFLKVLDNIRRAFFSNLVGLGVTTTYLFVMPGCVHYQQPGGLTLDYGGTLKGWRAVACGLTGSLLSMREAAGFIKNKFNPGYGKGVPTSLPSNTPDFCEGVYDDAG